MIEYIVFFILLILSAVFSGTETAFLSFRESKLQDLVKRKVKNANIIKKLKDDSYNTIIALLIGNNLVNITASSLATKITFDILNKYGISSGYGIAIATGIMTFLVLVFGEITPKTYAVAKYEKMMLKTAKLLFTFKIIFTPFIILFERISAFMLMILKVKREEQTYSEGELKAFVDMSEEEGSIKKKEKELIHNVLNFDDVRVKEIMTPIADVVALNEKDTIKNLIHVVHDSSYSRLPVYKDHIENIIGVVHIKDALDLIKQQKFDTNVKEVMRPVSFIPSSKRIHNLFQHFQKRQEHFACVVNEYGNILGIVTLENVLEELVGEIRDETDTKEEEQDIKKVNSNTFIVNATCDLEDLKEETGISLETDGSFHTVAGYIMDHAGVIPKEGHIKTIKNVEFTIIKSSNKRVELIKIVKKRKNQKKTEES